ncbi:MAG: c-type cytochrome [Acidobacteria bacterium]|nr:c-type cytochrome [Acidobacteriota bacterium]
MGRTTVPSGPKVAHRRWGDAGALFVLLAHLWPAGAGFAATRELLLGDAERGRETFQTQQCIVCHSVGGEGGRTAPDLARAAGRGFAPAEMVSLLWNHAPKMWAAMAKSGIRRPRLNEQQAADLFAFFFAARYFEKPGDARRGETLFEARRCAQCHGLAHPAREGIRPVSEWETMDDPIALAQSMWNHARDMKPAFESLRTVPPRLSPQDFTDLVAYVRSLPGTRQQSPRFAPDSTRNGGEVFAAKGCRSCHNGAWKLEARPTRYSFTEFAAAMWNHAPIFRYDPVRISAQDRRSLVGYLASLQFFEERGNPERGQAVFARKRCATCHDNPATGAPGLAGRAAE